MKNKLFRCLKNYFFCKKYPFWKLTDDWYNFNTSIDDSRKGSKNFFVKYNYIWYDDIPYGWQKAFGKKLSKEIKEVGIKYLKIHKDKTWNDILSFEQIKEKYGELCLYANSIRDIEKVLEKYELLSIGYCIHCGKPARYKTKGWIEYYCEKCLEKDYLRYDKYTDEELDKIKKENRLTKKDIPTIYVYNKAISGKLMKKRVNIKKKYGIDFIDLWRLK